MTNAQIGSADALRRIFPTALASYLQFRGWIRQETRCNGMSVHILTGNQSANAASEYRHT